MKALILLLTLPLSGCYLYLGSSYHNTDTDSEFKESGWIGSVGMAHEVNDNIEIFMEHSSMPMIHEKDGEGINEIGAKLKFPDF